MRVVKYEDQNGYLCASMVRDIDPDEVAPQGIPLCPPQLDELDWEELKKEINNELIKQDIFTYEDVMKSQNGVTRVLQLVLRRKIVTLFKQEHIRRRAELRSIK